MSRSSWCGHARFGGRRGVGAAVVLALVLTLATAGGAAALRAGPAATGPFAPGPAALAPPGHTGVPLEPPEIESFSPTRGPVGTLVTVKGYWFASDAQVRFNGSPATNVHVSSFQQLECTVPAGATSGPISLTTSFGTDTSAGELHGHGHDHERLDGTAVGHDAHAPRDGRRERDEELGRGRRRHRRSSPPTPAPPGGPRPPAPPPTCGPWSSSTACTAWPSATPAPSW